VSASPDLASCELCEHRCKVNRLAGELGVCGMAGPVVASAQVHPAPPASYTVFMAGCNLKCLNCQNWTVSSYPATDAGVRGFVDPAELARECVEALDSFAGRLISADRIFFSGGAPDIHLPYVEEVVREARRLAPGTRVNFDTNGFLTEASLRRVLAFATSVTFDIKAFSDEVHRTLTGASVKPVLRNAEIVGGEHRDQLWEYRVLVIPGMTDDQVEPLCDFIASIDRDLPVCFLAFRPNFALADHPGASLRLMERCLDVARSKGLTKAHWAGMPAIPGRVAAPDPDLFPHYRDLSARLAATYAARAGCATHPRDCAACSSNCRLKGYVPTRAT